MRQMPACTILKLSSAASVFPFRKFLSPSHEEGKGSSRLETEDGINLTVVK